SGFSATPGFTTATGAGYQGGIRQAAAGNGSQEGTWTFTALPPGTYRISGTWTAGSGRARRAPETVLDGDRVMGAGGGGQRQAADDFAEGGVIWEDLGSGVFTITSGTLVVRLTDLADGAVVADAIRLERLA